MRLSKYLLATIKESPADAEIISHKLMLRAGLIRKLASGLYSWLPLGNKVLRKITNIVREEMDKSGAMEVSMPIVQPAELWQESERWSQMGPELLRIQDRHKRDFCLGPTHEEVITDLVRNDYSSYKQLPAILYQIQTKFRDERRPRFGVMRSREFIMKDAYSFHINQESLDDSYKIMHKTYCNIFTRLGLNFRSVAADSGSIGGSISHEFHALADSGEDEIVFSKDGKYAANAELAEGHLRISNQKEDKKDYQVVDTGTAATIEEITNLLKVDTNKTVKTLLVHSEDEEGNVADKLVALLLRGDQELNITKTEKLKGIFSPLKFASSQLIEKQVGASIGSLGPQNLDIYKIADLSVEGLCNFVCGANETGKHFINMNWSDDCSYDEVADMRKVKEDDTSLLESSPLEIKRGIEVGHIFQLGTKYSDSMNASVLDKNGKAIPIQMGCYGIGITRLMAACIEQSHDDRGIIWPNTIAPFQLIIIQIDSQKSADVGTMSESMYATALNFGIETILDDRDRKTSPGVKLNESELIGIPHRIVVSPRTLEKNSVEYTDRRTGEKSELNIEDVEGFLKKVVLADQTSHL
tara:strand:- start:3986 stop:5737 length:1752 start_codon:yes stop_codon:yes gene_type:complete